MDIFTSISLNYLSKARTLAFSLKQLHPDWTFHLLISDKIKENEKYLFQKSDILTTPFDRVVFIEELPIENLYSFIFRHTVVELCTAVKGVYLKFLQTRGAKKVVYLDPDIFVFNSLTEVDYMLDHHAVLLTPHLSEPPHERQSIIDNEIAAVQRHGTFNLGFLAVNFERQAAIDFADWWENRLLNYCYAEYAIGLFTDQKWCDLVPSYFEDFFVIRDPGYDVASWNLDTRKITMSPEGQLVVNRVYPLRFYHFTGFDSGAGMIMTERYKDGNSLVDELWQMYARKIQQNRQGEFQQVKNFYHTFDNGVEITKEHRRIYRLWKDLQEKYPNPFSTKENQGFLNWFQSNQIAIEKELSQHQWIL